MDCFVAEPVIGPAERPDPLAPRNDGLLLSIFINRRPQLVLTSGQPPLSSGRNASSPGTGEQLVEIPFTLRLFLMRIFPFLTETSLTGVARIRAIAFGVSPVAGGDHGCK
jgi:hypothetical protein